MSDIIKLNVGGIKYQTTLNTLSKDPNSMLSAMFSGRHNNTADEEGYYFIDRDGESFKYLLKYLRDGDINIESLSYQEINNILDEANYFNLKNLINQLQDDPKYLNKKLKDFEFWYCPLSDVHWKLTTTDKDNLEWRPPRYERYYTFLSSTAKSVEKYFPRWSSARSFDEPHIIIIETDNETLHFYKLETTDAVEDEIEKNDNMYSEIAQDLTKEGYIDGDDDFGTELDRRVDKKRNQSPGTYLPLDDVSDISVKDFIKDCSDKYFVKLFELVGYEELDHITTQHHDFKIYYNPEKGQEILELEVKYRAPDGYKLNKFKYLDDDCDSEGNYYPPTIRHIDHVDYLYLGYKYIYYQGKQYSVSNLLEKEFVEYISNLNNRIVGRGDYIYRIGCTLESLVDDYETQYQIYKELINNCREVYYFPFILDEYNSYW